MDIASALAPTNIAVLKYWGKDEARGLNTPINSSCSLTLSSDDLRAETVVVASKELERDELWLNGQRIDTSGEATHSKRLRACLSTMRSLCGRDPIPASSTAANAEELSRWHVRVISRNTFPTAAGLASSAAGYAALVRALADLYGIREKQPGELSTIARRGSGSACRSLQGGLVAWHMGTEKLGGDSCAEQFFDEAFWPQLRVVVLVANAAEKETPSTEGMQRSVRTSPFLAHRAAQIAQPRLEEMRRAFEQKNFPAFGELLMRDSNSFHATCLDTYPPIFYLDATSRRVIDAAHAFNKYHGRVRVAYTFDAGPNAVVFCENARVADEFAALSLTLFAPSNDIKSLDKQALQRFTNLPSELAVACREHPLNEHLLDSVSHLAAPCLKMMYLTSVGGGAKPLSPNAINKLVDRNTGHPLKTAKSQWQKTLEPTSSGGVSTTQKVVAAVALVALAAAAALRRSS